MKATYNTKKRGLLRFIVFPEKDGDFCGVCLDLDLIEYGKDPEKLMESIQEAAMSMVKGIIEHNLSDEDLNRPASLKYWKMAEKICKSQAQKKTVDPAFFNLVQKPYPQDFQDHAQN
jgi:predicted RNase H-like HicB family nuclease